MDTIFANLRVGINYALNELKTYGVLRTSGSWQGLKQQQRMWEYDELRFRACMPQGMMQTQRECQPTLPWAEDHFQERVAGEPLNPGEQYKNWPFYGNVGQSNSRFRNVDEQFSHTYMERYWPKFTGPDLKMFGIRYEYGDLMDVIGLLEKEPDTRQAYLPVWFPEDTGVKHGGRVPCTLGYHFIIREYRLHIHYYIRACDALRHFRNDIYMTVRLGQWVLARLIERDLSKFGEIQMGVLTMSITNFHVFEKERNLI